MLPVRGHLHKHLFSFFFFFEIVEMSVARTRAFTHTIISIMLTNIFVEMSVARTRAFTRPHLIEYGHIKQL